MVIHRGLTRAYMLRNGTLFQITHDHGFCLLGEDPTAYPRPLPRPSRTFTNATDLAPDLYEREPRPLDRYLLCGSEIGHTLPPDEIHRALTGNSDPRRAGDSLLRHTERLAPERGGACVLIDVL